MQIMALFLETPYGQLPVLSVDGVDIAQSFAIARFLARRYGEMTVFVFETYAIYSGLAGKDDIESAKLDSIADSQKDFMNEVSSYFQVMAGRKEGDKEKLYKVGLTDGC